MGMESDFILETAKEEATSCNPILYSSSTVSLHKEISISFLDECSSLVHHEAMTMISTRVGQDVESNSRPQWGIFLWRAALNEMSTASTSTDYQDNPVLSLVCLHSADRARV
ncbi:Uncharacterized protein TCM_041712 [Theobroma cacao]|uniref:Uncharacterized protein n=1 Tax=Theobroma cacao TaxID=3641 RepID=A0A061GWK5_THECC|nr:Uncharacterized protein TCM_041712 [Theobroma cacao]